MIDDLDQSIKEFIQIGFDKKYPKEFQKLLDEKESSKNERDTFKEAELVVKFLDRPNEARKIVCKWCDNYFITNYKYQSYCSVECLKAKLLSIGLKWNPNKKMEDRWKGEPPSTIKPHTLKVLIQWAESLIAFRVSKPQLATSQNNPEKSNSLEVSEVDLLFSELFP